MAEQQPQQKPNPVIKPEEVNEWIGRVRDAAAKPETITGPAAADARPWNAAFFGCFNPIDTCLVTWCCPCVTFGKVHHRLRKDANMKDYSPVNTTCLGWWAAACFCLGWVPSMIQRREIQDKYNLQGDFATDCLKAWCCGCCDIIQQEKESSYRLLEQGGVEENIIKAEPKPMMQDGGMSYPSEPAPAAGQH